MGPPRARLRQWLHPGNDRSGDKAGSGEVRERLHDCWFNRNGKRGHLVDKTSTRKEFWEGFCIHLKKVVEERNLSRICLKENLIKDDGNWLRVDTNISGIHFSLSFNTAAKWAKFPKRSQVNLVIDRGGARGKEWNKAIFDGLLNHRPELESMYQTNLLWQAHHRNEGYETDRRIIAVANPIHHDHISCEADEKILNAWFIAAFVTMYLWFDTHIDSVTKSI